MNAGNLGKFYTKHPEVSSEVTGKDLDLAEGLVIPAPTHLLKRATIAESQRAHATTRPKALTLTKEKPALWVTETGRVWIPDADRALQKCLYAVAHQGMSGHRGKDVTSRILQRRFVWKDFVFVISYISLGNHVHFAVLLILVVLLFALGRG